MNDPKSLKVPPHDISAEKSVLGSLLLDKDAFIKIGDILHGDDFYFENNAIIYQTIEDLFNKRKPIDLLTLASALRDNKNIEKVGGESYLSFDESSEIDQLLEQAEKALYAVSQNFIKDRFVHIKEILEATYEKISELHDAEQKDKYRGIPTGFKGLDHVLSGFQPADLVILAARPAMGKTSMALNVAQNIAKIGKSIGFISLEMSKEQLVERLFCSLLAVDSWKLRTGQLSDDDFSRIGSIMDELNQSKIFIDDSAGSSISELRTKARRLQMESGLDVLFIDYLQLMSIDKRGASVTNRVQEISEISRSLKVLARELRIPIVALSQLSRAVEQRPSKVPQLADLRESGAIEQDADVVLMMYREDYYEEDTDREGITDIYIRKHRNGPTGRVELRFKKEQMRFYDLELQRNPQGASVEF
ncbi:MAG: Sa14-24 Replicative DNA helicase [Candidatus Peregrinibacteria bacterium GW2011_GWA2_33_10]|nr:MAG: Sa14-24 Replicative DNA helicase [Candidatus Peregrinibacteria bacterium GW2011_GWA2_33_10]